MTRPRLPFNLRPGALAAALLCVGMLGGSAVGQTPPVQTPLGQNVQAQDLQGQAGPRPPQPQVTLTLAQTRTVLARAAQIVAALQVGSVRSAPAGPEAVLTYQGQAVSTVALDLQGNVLPLATPPLPGGGPAGRRPGPWAAAPTPPALPATGKPVTLSAQARARLSAQVRGLYVSGAVRAVGPQVRVTLLSGAVAVAELRFGEGGALKPLPDPGRDGPAGR